MFGKKSRLERENDKLEEQIARLHRQLDEAEFFVIETDRKWLRLLREYRYTQKSCERRKRANKKLRAMLDDVGWPKNDKKPYTKMAERLVPRKLP